MPPAAANSMNHETSASLNPAYHVCSCESEVEFRLQVKTQMLALGYLSRGMGGIELFYHLSPPSIVGTHIAYQDSDLIRP